MAASSKKKKKSTRPIATTSAPSKSQLLKVESDESTTLPSPSEPTNDVNVAACTEPVVEGSSNLDQLHTLNPDELEKHLQAAEVQRIVERYASKVRKDAIRNSAKFQNERRLLRSNSEALPTHRLLPQQFQNRILDLALKDMIKYASDSDRRRARKEWGTENALVKLWGLETTLLELGFSQELTREALTRLILHPPSSAAGALQVWGLDKSLEWLTLNCDEGCLPKFDNKTGKPQGEPELHPPLELPHYDNEEIQIQAAAYQVDSQSDSNPPHTPVCDSDLEVSEIESDLEPEQLLTTYLSAKTQLYERRPDIVESDSSNHSKTRKGRQQTANSANTSPGVKKLQQKLKKLESDILFDKTEADKQWTTKRNTIARDFKRARKVVSAEEVQPETKNLDHQSESANTKADATSDAEDDDVFELGDLFNASPLHESTDHRTRARIGTDYNAEAMQIQDFGGWKGISPRRVLEEACRARDPGAQLSYCLDSSIAFSNRHSLKVAWSIPQRTSETLRMASVVFTSTPTSTSFLMKSIATPDRLQSEAYISTVALFQIFAASPKEEKVFLRLPSVWRVLWSELAEQWQEQVAVAQRADLHSLMELIRVKVEQDLDEDEILTSNFKSRHNGSSTSDSPSRRKESEKPDSGGPDTQELMAIWSAKCKSTGYRRMLQSREKLPMYAFREIALSMIDKHQVTIISGETGCGKSTQLPAYILENELSRGHDCKIYCTEPRRISAITLAQRVSEELGENRRDLGSPKSLVGYAIRLESVVSDQTRLIFATTGIVLRMLESTEGLRDVTHVVIDEVHERSIETDFLLIIVRALLIKRQDLKVVLMSATLDTERFSRYFNGAPVLSVPGRTFSVETKYLEDAIELTGHSIAEENRKGYEDNSGDMDERNDARIIPTSYENYSKSTRSALSQLDEYRTDYDLIVKLIEMVAFDPVYTRYARAILVFLPGIAEIKRLHDLLSGIPIAQKYVIHALHSSIASEDQQAAFALPPKERGKIILSTNIAETGVTIPDITCVIDTGKHKEMRFDEKRQISRLAESFISRANAKQRRGRAGRVQEGICFHLFTRLRHDHAMNEQQTPEMLRLSLQDLVMRVKICKLGDIESTLAEALDPPSSKNVRRAIDALIDVGALNTAESLTYLGQQLARIPLDPYLGKLILFGALFGCLDFSITVAAILTSKPPFITPVGAKKQADAARLSFKKGDSDLVTDYNAYLAWRRVCLSGGSEMQFCRKNCLSPQNLANAEDLKSQLLSSIAELGFTVSDRVLQKRSGRRRFVEVPPELNGQNSNLDVISAATAWAFYPKILARYGNGWRSIATNQSVQLHPASIPRSVQIQNVNFLSFYSILQAGGGRAYNASSVTPVSPLALLLLAGDASYHPVAQVLSLDGARLRFRAEGWKTYVATKLLRQHLREIMEMKWQEPAALLAPRLARWWEVWSDLAEEWASRWGAPNNEETERPKASTKET